ncbi:MAG: Trm112 family protein, partial [Tepidiformaceae bacterium]
MLKPRLADLLVCPIDGGELELIEWDSTPSPLSGPEMARVYRMGLHGERFSRDIHAGLLLNRRRQVFFPIVEGVPRMLVFPTAVVTQFVRRNRLRIERDAPGFAPPAESGTPGEETVLRTFSSEWLHYEWDERAYWGQSAEDLFRSMDFALDFEHKELRDKLVLEVGIGIGGIADHVVRSQKCELVGLDLSHAVDAAYKHFQENPFLHVVQA